MKKMFFLLVGMASLSSLTFAEDITALNGTVYKNVAIEGVNPAGIDIGYVNDKGDFVLRGLKFTELPQKTQEKFGYKVADSQQFEQKINKYATTDMEDVVGTAKSRLEAITKEIKQKLAGADIKIKPDDLRYAVFALRRAVKIKPVGSLRQGCVAEIEEVISGKPLKSKKVLLDGINLPPDSSWTGFIYPTGAKANYQDMKGLPVFADRADRAIDIINKYLNIYSEYAATQNTGSTDADQSVNAPDQNDNDSSVDTDNSNAANAADSDADEPDDDTAATTSAATAAPPVSQPDQSDYQQPYYNNFENVPNDDGYGYGYYFGGNYGPVNWYWHHHHYPHHKPQPVRKHNPASTQNREQECGGEQREREERERQISRNHQTSWEHNENHIGGFHHSSGYHGGGGHGGGGRR